MLCCRVRRLSIDRARLVRAVSIHLPFYGVLFVRPGWTGALESTTERYGMGAVELLEKRRWRRTVQARQYFWLLLHDTYGWSYPEIARYTGDYNHTTVLSGVRKARKREAESNAAPSGVHETVQVQEAYDDQTG